MATRRFRYCSTNSVFPEFVSFCSCAAILCRNIVLQFDSGTNSDETPAETLARPETKSSYRATENFSGKSDSRFCSLYFSLFRRCVYLITWWIMIVKMNEKYAINANLWINSEEGKITRNERKWDIYLSCTPNFCNTYGSSILLNFCLLYFFYFFKIVMRIIVVLITSY